MIVYPQDDQQDDNPSQSVSVLKLVNNESEDNNNSGSKIPTDSYNAPASTKAGQVSREPFR